MTAVDSVSSRKRPFTNAVQACAVQGAPYHDPGLCACMNYRMVLGPSVMSARIVLQSWLLDMGEENPLFKPLKLPSRRHTAENRNLPSITKAICLVGPL